MRKYANKRRLMHTWKNSHIFSHTCTSAQEELLTLITDTHMQRQPHTHTLKRTYRPRVVCMYIHLHGSTTYAPEQTMVDKYKYTYANN